MRKKEKVLVGVILGGIGLFLIIFGFINKEEKEIKADTKVSFYQIWENMFDYFLEETEQNKIDPIETPNKSPDPTVTKMPSRKKFVNVEEMKLAEVKVGDYVETQGYYEEADGGGGCFQIKNRKELKENGGTIIYLKNGLVASLVVQSERVSIKQFGAKTGSNFDNADAFNRAFSVEDLNIEFPKGEYKVKKQFEIKGNNINIWGNDSVVYVDNEYKDYKGYSECLMIISHVNNMMMTELNFEFRQTKRKACGKQFEISFSKNVSIANCDFIIPKTIHEDETDKEEIKKTSSYCNGSLWTAWENIIISGCKFVQLSDSDIGGCVGINDYYSKGCANVSFVNNTCEYMGHDECIAIFSLKQSKIEGVKIKDNTITALPSEGSIPRTMCFSIGYSDSQIEDVTISGNTIKGYADFAFMTIGNAKNVTVEENKLTYLKMSKKCAPIMFRADVKEFDSNILIRKNEINIQQEIEDTIGMGGICEGKIRFQDNQVTYDVYGYTIFSKDADVENNKLYLNKGGNEIVAEIKNFVKNTVVVDGGAQYLFKFQDKVLDTDICISDNEIFYNYEGEEKNQVALLVSKITLNDRKFIFSRNTIHTLKDTVDKYLYSINILDVTPQNIEISNNITGNFIDTEVIKCNLGELQAIIDNNEN